FGAEVDSNPAAAERLADRDQEAGVAAAQVQRRLEADPFEQRHGLRRDVPASEHGCPLRHPTSVAWVVPGVALASQEEGVEAAQGFAVAACQPDQVALVPGQRPSAFGQLEGARVLEGQLALDQVAKAGLEQPAGLALSAGWRPKAGSLERLEETGHLQSCKHAGDRVAL